MAALLGIRAGAKLSHAVVLSTALLGSSVAERALVDMQCVSLSRDSSRCATLLGIPGLAVLMMVMLTLIAADAARYGRYSLLLLLALLGRDSGFADTAAALLC